MFLLVPVPSHLETKLMIMMMVRRCNSSNHGIWKCQSVRSCLFGSLGSLYSTCLLMISLYFISPLKCPQNELSHIQKWHPHPHMVPPSANPWSQLCHMDIQWISIVSPCVQLCSPDFTTMASPRLWWVGVQRVVERLGPARHRRSAGPCGMEPQSRLPVGKEVDDVRKLMKGWS